MFNLKTNIYMKNETTLNHCTPPDAKHLLGNVMDLFNEFKKVTHLTVMRRLKCTYREALDVCEELESQGRIIYRFDKGAYYVA
jgi:hypothetical protein